MTLYPHQIEVLNQTKNRDHVAYYLDMGLGKTYVGSEKMNSFSNPLNLLICQKSKIEDWREHFTQYYSNFMVIDYAKMGKKISIDDILSYSKHIKVVVIVNYELAWRRPELRNLYGCCLMLDESSLIQNHKAKQTRFIMTIKAREVILLSGTPCSGKYENLYTQGKLLGVPITKTQYDRIYVNWKLMDFGNGIFRIPDPVHPYRNVEKLKADFRQHGAVFLKTEECFDLPEQTFIKVNVPINADYKRFKKNRYVEIENEEVIGDSNLSYRLGMRKLCSIYSTEKYSAFEDLLNSTSDRLIVFYNFNAELAKLKKIVEDHKRPISEINGSVKDLTAYETESNSVTLSQYQAGSMGLNLQKANKIVYFSLPERSDLFEQSKKRIHRIGQKNTCFYYIMLCKGSIEEQILRALERKEDYTDELFREWIKEGAK